MSESNFWKTVKRNLPSDCHATRIENRHGGGVPDVHIVWNGFAFWIELKVCKGNKVNLSPQQNAWLSAYSRKGGISFILAKHPKQRSIYLFDGSQASEVFDKGLDAKTLYHGSCFKELFSKIGAWGLGLIVIGIIVS